MTLKSASMRFGTWVFALVVAGCSRPAPSGPAATPVQGTVLYQGKPAAGFRVVFHPLFDLGTVKFAPFGMTDEKGVFHLRSYTPNDGAPVGQYAVTFEWPTRPPAMDLMLDPGARDVDQLAGKYSRVENSAWKINVQEGSNELEPFRLE